MEHEHVEEVEETEETHEVPQAGYTYFSSLLTSGMPQVQIEHIEDVAVLPDGVKWFKTRGELKSFLNGQRKKNRDKY